MKIYIRQETSYYYIVRYVLKLIEKNTNHQFQFINYIDESAIIWDHEHAQSEIIATEFYSSIKNDLPFTFSLNSDIAISNGNNKKDAIATIFYMVNCIQELNLNSNSIDKFGRYKYESSYQYRLENIDQNLVQKEIDELCVNWKISRVNEKSTFFISHDIDTIYGSFLQDGFWALKKFRIDVILNLIIWEVSKNPHWRNIDKIIKLNTEYDIRSTYFWIVNKGKGYQNIKNADYDLIKEKDLLNKVEDSKSINGLHKSCSKMTIDEELNKGNLETKLNRYHFLKFKTHEDWNKISESKLDFDCSLGFAEHYGFRNSYGKAFQPFDVINNKPYNFIEAPLHFMDGTFHKYMKINSKEIAKTIIDFYEKNPTNCDFSLLWHNTYFTNYKYGPFLNVYKNIIEYIFENKIQCITPEELIKKNKLSW